ncbi:uncharacterized protein LOC125580418 [Brassica napus]|uniref:uncharacterized protein LOC125580418 n=1 Tax=Brassica napus TaxID=3708 RepID=UPI0020791841|nr:uncharacterized protein LOC125580418 [Brassica napus]
MAAEILTGHQLPSAFPKDYSISPICQSSAEEEAAEQEDDSSSEPEEYCDGSSSDIESDLGDDDASSVEDVSSSSSEDEGGNEDSSEDDEAGPPATKIHFPRRSRALKVLSEDFRKDLAKESMKTISQEDAEKCLARDGNFIPADTDLNQKEVIDACGVVQSVSSTMSITMKNDHEMIPKKDMTKFQLCSNMPASDYLLRLQTILLTDPQGAVNFALMMSQTEGGCPVNFNTITDLFLQKNLLLSFWMC